LELETEQARGRQANVSNALPEAFGLDEAFPAQDRKADATHQSPNRAQNAAVRFRHAAVARSGISDVCTLHQARKPTEFRQRSIDINR
jgi:hypothetical protein